MGSLGRFLVRFVSYSGYGILVAAAITFSFSDVKWLQSAGWLLALFLADRVAHLGKAERSLAHLPRFGSINIALYLSPQTLLALEWAFERVFLVGGNFYLHLLKKLADRREIREALIRMDVPLEDFLKKIESGLEASLSIKNDRKLLLESAEGLAAEAFKKALIAKSDFVHPKDLFSAIGGVTDEKITSLLKLFDIVEGDLESALIFGVFKGVPSFTGFIGRPYKVRHRVMNRAWTARPTPNLDAFGEDLTDLARLAKVGFLVGHQQEYDRLEDVLSRPGNPNALLVGDPGAGKETIIAHLAYQVTKDRVSPPLFDKRLVKLDIGRLVAGAAEGELQNRIKKIIDEIALAGNVILYIPEIHNLAKTSGELRLSAADTLLPAIKSSAFSVIGTSYPREFRELIEPNTEFASAFEVIRVQELSEPEAVRFLVYVSIFLERQYKILITFKAVKEAVRLAHKYFRQKLLPASAEDLLKEVLADMAGKGDKILNPEDVIAIAERKVNVPIHKAGKEEAKQLLNLENLIHQRLIDQDEAVKLVAQALREYRSGLARKGGPIAAFLFVGPTGVGKTELSKILAKIQFGSSEAMVRFDMSEYQDKSTVNRLLENVTAAIREKPYSLILLDEFEKAHPDILNLFLQVFDDGRLTDLLGRTVDFQNTIIIATSNAHSNFIKSAIEAGRGMKEISDDLKKKLTEYFRPELLNRFSGITVFKNLSPADIQAIAGIQLLNLADQLRENQSLELYFDESAIQKVAELGYDPVFGARPLRGVISDKIKGVLAEKILRGEFVRGQKIKVAFENGEFSFSNVEIH